MSNISNLEELTEMLTTLAPNQEAGDIRKVLFDASVTDTEDIELVEINSDDLFRVENKMRKGEPLTEDEEMLEEIVIGANIRGMVQLNQAKIEEFHEKLRKPSPEASIGYKEFVRAILVGGIKFGNKPIWKLTPEQQKNMGFEFEKEVK